MASGAENLQVNIRPLDRWLAANPPFSPSRKPAVETRRVGELFTGIKPEPVVSISLGEISAEERKILERLGLNPSPLRDKLADTLGGWLGRLLPF